MKALTRVERWLLQNADPAPIPAEARTVTQLVKRGLLRKTPAEVALHGGDGAVEARVALYALTDLGRKTIAS